MHITKRQHLLLVTLLALVITFAFPLHTKAADQVAALRSLGLDHPAIIEALQNGGAAGVRGQRIADRAYSYAGMGQGNFDCSLFVQTVLSQEGYAGPRSASEYADWGEAVDVVLWDVDLDKLLPGDVIGYDTLNWGSTCHVGIYLGDGQAIHVNTVDRYMEVCDIGLRANFPITFIRRAAP